ncbi:alpha/beta hydrolase [Seohaeicola zhoushanensis]|uniref:Alpha/beta hydrolase n=2 Tax=Seohaeicola zhoushanensis TaxID=1569283 RepID=A0A8J3GTU9_9RHOB|nr:alpha/beta hydrolase [Seohaeicola zhoushanensis]
MLDMQTMKPMTGSAAPEAISFPAPGATLQGTLYLPASPPRAAVVLNGATAVPQGFYRAFATWLANSEGIACLTYDYRDFARSAQAHPKHSTATMADWALRDQPAARAEMRRRLPGVPLWVIGHSLGGMLMPMQEGIEDIDRMIAVASGLVHHQDHPWPYQGLARLFWFGHVPALTRLLGYLPGRIAGFGPDLPATAYWQWREWCTHPHSYFPHLGASLPQPAWHRSSATAELIALADDPVCPPVSTAKLVGVYGVEQSRFRVLDPAEKGLSKVGHLGAFARANAALWPEIIG